MTRATDRHVWAWMIVASLSFVACKGGGSPSSENPPSTPPAAAAQAPPKDQPVNPDAQALAGFLDRVNEYVTLRKKLEDALPKLPKEATPEQIDKNQRALGQMIRDARSGAKRGDIFTSESEMVIKKLLAKVFGGPDGPALKASIMDENPGVPKIVVNERYPDEVPLSTIPPQVLEGLPKMPKEMEFRFIGNTLVLMDVDAHIIADFIADAFPHSA